MSSVVIIETLRRQMTVITVIYFALLALLATAMARPEAPGTGWLPLLGLLMIVATAQLIGPEFSTGTLQLILAKPVNRTVYLVSRVIGVWLGISIVVWLLLAMESAAIALGRHDVAWRQVFARGVNTCADALLLASLMALLGSVTRAYFNVAIYFAGMMAISAAPVALQAIRRQESGFFGRLADFLRDERIDRAIAWVNRNVFADAPPDFNRDWLLMVLSNAAVALFLAAIFFRRREVPYGGD